MGARSMLRPGGRAASPRDAALPEFPHRILLVDDDDGVRRSLERLLASRFRVDAADGAPAARALLSAGFYDVVLCDVMMPRESGVDFFDSLDATSRGQVVFMTGGVLGVELQDRLQRTERPVLLKPLTLPVLEAAFRELTTRARGSGS